MTGSPSGSPDSPPTGSSAAMAPPVPPLDVLVLQTAASLENLAVQSYSTAAELPFVVRGSARLRALVTRNRAHHLAHARAFNQAVVRAGGAPQHAADPLYATTVRRRLAAMTDPDTLVSLLTELEGNNAGTCTRYASLAERGGLRSLFVNVASVEAQHGAELLILRMLPENGTTAAHARGATARAVPAAAGTVGVPHAVYPTTAASAINEGAVR
ncbi:ferritin-like domain-containing protein [Streptomyces sp. NPDC058464]|uniref:ferritin-like domain-containing protein n=1 Tax=Streptomyces sp. NPDC058464 TaxID=3346511 RepID=UPI003649CA99